MSIANLKNIPDGEWVNDPLTGIIHDTREINSKDSVFYIGTMSYSGIDIGLTSNESLAGYENKVVEIGGQGNKKATFKGRPQVRLGRNAILKIIGDAPQEAPPRQAGGTPVAMTEVNGQSVGNGITNATTLIMYIYEPEEVKELIEKKEFHRLVAHIAGSYVKVGQWLCGGNLDGYPDMANDHFTTNDLPEDEKS